jgi:hypothetical protein
VVAPTAVTVTVAMTVTMSVTVPMAVRIGGGSVVVRGVDLNLLNH